LVALFATGRDTPLYAARFSLLTFAACLPNAIRVFFGKCAIVLFLFAAAAAFLVFRLAAARCFALAMAYLLVPLVDEQAPAGSLENARTASASIKIEVVPLCCSVFSVVKGFEIEDRSPRFAGRF
jgi:hypothetical protein